MGPMRGWILTGLMLIALLPGDLALARLVQRHDLVGGALRATADALGSGARFGVAAAATALQSGVRAAGDAVVGAERWVAGVPAAPAVPPALVTCRFAYVGLTGIPDADAIARQVERRLAERDMRIQLIERRAEAGACEAEARAMRVVRLRMIEHARTHVVTIVGGCPKTAAVAEPAAPAEPVRRSGS